MIVFWQEIRHKRREADIVEYVKIMRDLREDNDKTQAQIAKAIGTSQTMYSRYERGASELPIRHLVFLCKLYGVSADYFLGLSKKKELRLYRRTET